MATIDVRHQFNAEAALGRSYAANAGRHDLVGTVAGPASGTVQCTGIIIPAGVTINDISMIIGSTGATSPTHQIAGIYQGDTLLATTADATSAAISANTLWQKTLTASWTCPETDYYSIGFFITASVMPTFAGYTLHHSIASSCTAIPLCGTADTGRTTSLPSTKSSITATTSFVAHFLGIA